MIKNTYIKIIFLIVFSCGLSLVSLGKQNFQISGQVSAAWLHDNMPTRPVEITAYATLEDYYNFGYMDSKPTHYSIRLTNENDIYGTGYIPRRSAGGQALFNALQDGKPHLVTIAVVYDYRSQGDGSIFLIADVLKIEQNNDYSQNPGRISAAWLHANMPTRPVEITAYATLEDYYNFGYMDSKPTHYSIRLTNENDNYGTGYIPRRSAGGQALFNALQDGKPHLVTVAVVYDCRSQGTGSVFLINSVINIEN